MKNNFKYIKNIFKVLIWPIMFIIGQFFVQYIFVAMFNLKEKGTLTNQEFMEHIKTTSYKIKLDNFINHNTLLIVTIISIIFIPILYKFYKKYKQKNNYKIKEIVLPIILGITISLIYNILLFNINNIAYITNTFEQNSLPIYLQIICSGIIGPIMEELLFRGIIYNKLKKFNKPMTAIILTSLIFAIFHGDIINGIYAFIVSFMLIYLYEKYKTLKAPIIMHMFLNITIIFMLNLINKNFLIFNFYLLIVSLLVLVIITKKFIKKDV